MNARDNRSITSTRLKSRVGRIHKSLTSYGTILFVLFIAFSSTGLYFLKNTTMSNTRATITEMSTRVGTKAIAALDHQQQFLETAAHYLADKQQDAKLTGRNIDYLTWLKDCYSLLSRNFGTAHFELHVYVDGVLYTTASRAQGGILPFDGRDALWYQRALQNHGRTVLIDPYTDLFTGTRIITLAARVGNTQNVLACDLFPELSRITELDNLLPQGFSFYLTDSHGYIAAYTAQGTSYREAQETVNTYFLPLFNDPETFAARSIVFVDAEEEDLLAVLIRDPVTMEPLGYDRNGILNFVSPMNTAVPVTSLMMGDFAVMHPPGSCRCGNPAPWIEIAGRAGIKANRSCAIAAAELLRRR